MNVVQGAADGTGLRVAVVAARFNEVVTAALVDGAVEGLRRVGVADEAITVAWVPGAFEIPLVARRFAERGDIDTVICLGAVIRGETDHYEYVSAEAARGIQQVQLQTGVPCAFGVITCETMEQALARAGGDKRDQGRNAAVAVLRMALIREALG